jgi:hypothetical protein
MNPNTRTTFNLTKPTREELGALYFLSIENDETRRAHVLLPTARENVTPQDIERDVSGWFAGVYSILKAVEPNTTMPTLREMVNYISQHIDRVKGKGTVAA